jgi:hypothetical protein
MGSINSSPKTSPTDADFLLVISIELINDSKKSFFGDHAAFNELGLIGLIDFKISLECRFASIRS